MQSDPSALSTADLLLTFVNPVFVFFLCVTVFVIMHLKKTPGLIKESVRFLHNRPWRMEHVLSLTLMIFLALFLTRAIVTLLLSLNVIQENNLISLSIVLQAIFLHLPVILVVWMISRKLKPEEPDSSQVPCPDNLHKIGKGLITYAASLPLIIIAGMASWVSLKSLGVPQEPQFAVQVLVAPHPSWLKIHLILMAIVSAPIAEELLFRGVFFPALAKHTSPLRSAILTSLLFAAVHMNAYAFLPLFVMAVGLCAGYAFTKSLVVPITAHALFNAVSIALYMLQASGKQ